MSPSTVETSAPLLGEPLPVELMNTIWADTDGVHDALADAGAAGAWLAAVADRLPVLDGVRGKNLASVGTMAAVALRDLRDALRRLAAEVTDDRRTHAESAVAARASALAIVNGACAAAPVWSELTWAKGAQPRRHLRSAEPGAGVVAAIAEQAVELFSGAHVELRACQAPGCVLYFLRDHPRRQWCSAGCGNRARVARHYQRHHGSSIQ